MIDSENTFQGCICNFRLMIQPTPQEIDSHDPFRKLNHENNRMVSMSLTHPGTMQRRYRALSRSMRYQIRFNTWYGPSSMVKWSMKISRGNLRRSAVRAIVHHTMIGVVQVDKDTLPDPLSPYVCD